MKTKAPSRAVSAILRDFPNTYYHADQRLITWHPRGTFDDELADKIVQFIEMEERSATKPFHRYTDLSGLDRVELSLGHVFEIAQQRKHRYRGVLVKSAFYAVRLISVTIARMYQELMQDSQILVGVFRDRTAAAGWLGVPEETLKLPGGA